MCSTRTTAAAAFRCGSGQRAFGKAHERPGGIVVLWPPGRIVVRWLPGGTVVRRPPGEIVVRWLPGQIVVLWPPGRIVVLWQGKTWAGPPHRAAGLSAALRY